MIRIEIFKLIPGVPNHNQVKKVKTKMQYSDALQLSRLLGLQNPNALQKICCANV